MTGAWGFSAKSTQGELTGPDQKLSLLQIDVLRWAMRKRGMAVYALQ
jgi:hypothetical protein